MPDNGSPFRAISEPSLKTISSISAAKIIPTEPPSYANLLKSDTISSGMSFASAMSNNSGSVRPVNTYSSRTQQDARSETSQSLPAQQRQINSRQQQPRGT